MDGSGFSQDGLTGEDDPFAGSEDDFATYGQPEVEAAQPAVAEESPLPVVDREGQPVQEPTEPEDPTPGSGQPSETSAPAPAEPVAAEPEPSGSTGAEAAPEAPVAEPEQAEQPSEPSAKPGSTPTPPSSEAPGAAAGTGSGGAEKAGESVAEPPKETAGGTKRQYKLFAPDGLGKFSEVTWAEKGGKVVPKGTAGAKKQSIVLARGQEDALHHGFVVMGCPAQGVSLIAVAATYWQVRHVQPDPIQPIRQRLRIS